MGKKRPRPARAPGRTPPGLALRPRVEPRPARAPLQRPLPGALRLALPSAPPDAAAGAAIRHWVKNSSVPPAPPAGPRPQVPTPAPRPALPARPGSAPSPAQPAAAAGRPSTPARLGSGRAAAMQRRGALFGMPGGSGSRKMAAGDIGELLVPHMPTIRVPRSGDRVYKNECAFSYDSPVSGDRRRPRRSGEGRGAGGLGRPRARELGGA